MVSIVVSHQERFAKQSLPIAMRDFSGEVVFGVGNEFTHCFQVS
jgi:hypothetical protein